MTVCKEFYSENHRGFRGRWKEGNRIQFVTFVMLPPRFWSGYKPKQFDVIHQVNAVLIHLYTTVFAVWLEPAAYIQPNCCAVAAVGGDLYGSFIFNV